MPKAKPLPTDQQQREKVIRGRAKTVEKVRRWKQAHPETNRAWGRHTMRLHRARLAMRQQIASLG